MPSTDDKEDRPFPGAIKARRDPGASTLHLARDDERLAGLAARGEQRAFGEIFERYGQDLYRFCLGLLREPQDAQDAVQNTMIRAMRALPGETREIQLKPWLYRIAHNEAIELRRRVRLTEQLTPTVEEERTTTFERAEQDERLRTLLDDVADLPERQRAALVMRELNGLGFGEIAAALGTSPGAVRQALYEARRCLAQMDRGRAMDCAAAMRAIYREQGGPRGRDVRAHLRACQSCRRFQAGIRRLFEPTARSGAQLDSTLRSKRAARGVNSPSDRRGAQDPRSRNRN